MWHSNDPLGGTIGTDVDVLFSRSTNDGATWSGPISILPYADSDSSDDRNMRLATDRAGRWIGVYDTENTLGGTIGSDRDVLYVVSTDNGASWSAPAPLNTNAASDSGSDVNARVVHVTGDIYVAAWTSTDTLGGTISASNNILFSRTTDGGVTWSAPAPLQSNANDGSTEVEPYLACAADGTCIAVWSSTNSLGGTVGTDRGVMFARSTDGGATWSATALLNSNGTSDTTVDDFAGISTDGNGSWLAVWSSRDYFWRYHRHRTRSALQPLHR